MKTSSEYIDNPAVTPQVLDFELELVYGYRPVPAPLTETKRFHTFEGMDRYLRSQRLTKRGRDRCTQARYRLLLTKFGQENLTKKKQAELNIGKFTNI